MAGAAIRGKSSRDMVRACRRRKLRLVAHETVRRRRLESTVPVARNALRRLMSPRQWERRRVMIETGTPSKGIHLVTGGTIA